MLLNAVRSDTLPENTRYRDTGCEISNSCFVCPLPVCKFDAPGWVQRQNRYKRDEEIKRLRNLNISVPELAERFKVSTRTVHRIVRKNNDMDCRPQIDEGPMISLSDLDQTRFFKRRRPLPKIPIFKVLKTAV